MPKDDSDLLAPLEPSSDDPIAVIVIHGIGQQAQFETLNYVIEAFERSHTARSWTTVPHNSRETKEDAPAKIDFIPTDGAPDDLLPRAQLEMKRQDGSTQSFHFFEVYWAPLTEGVVGFWDVILYLLRAGYSGMIASMRGSFRRYTFGKVQEYDILRLTGLQLAFAFFLVLSFVLFSGSFWIVFGADVFGRFVPALSRALPVWQLRWTLISAAGASLPLLIPPLITSWLQHRSNRKQEKRTISSFERGANFLVVIPFFIVMIAYGGFVFSILLTQRAPWPLHVTLWTSRLYQMAAEWLAGPRFGFGFGIPREFLRRVGLTIFTAGGIAVAYKFWYFLVKYVGDITAYVSSFAVNCFWKVRSEIQDRALAIGNSVYSQRVAAGESEFQYQNVVVVGHSLGTVIGYDMLNTLINLNEMKPLAENQRIAERTRLFLTCGSPLNKIAFLFRFQMQAGFPKWREILNNFKQPLVIAKDRSHRPQRWTNIWCFADWISGRLSYYEPAIHSKHPIKKNIAEWQTAPDTDEAMAIREQTICEFQDREGVIPLMAHTQYFGHEEFRRRVYDALWKDYRKGEEAYTHSTAAGSSK